MKLNKTLTIGTLAALLVGTILSAMAATSQGQVDDSPMTVPAGRVGDRYAYGQFILEAEMAAFLGDEATVSATVDVGGGGGSSAASAEPAAPELQYFAVDRVGKTIDRQGRSHDVVVVKQNLTSPDHESTYYDHIDLGTRETVRVDSKLLSERGSGFDQDLMVSQLGDFDYTVRGIELQGRTFRLGDDLTGVYPSMDERIIQTGFGYSYGYGTQAPVSLRSFRYFRVSLDYNETPTSSPWQPDVRVWVADRALLDGRDAYAIRAEAALTVPPEAADDDSFFAPFVGKRMTFVEVAWVTAEVPYPVLLDLVLRVRDDGKDHTLFHTQDVLAEYKPGATPIPWKADAPLGVPSVPERSPAGALVPADGQGSRLPFPLSTALQDANGALAPLEFQLWRTNHPGNLLVSAELRRGESATSQNPSYEWTLVYAVPTGTGFEIDIERPGTGPAKIDAHGERTTPKFALTDLPSGPITLGAAERAWMALASPAYAQKAPSFVHWGFELRYEAGPICGTANTIVVTGPQAAQSLRKVYIGATSEGSCVETPPALEESAAVVETDSGDAIGAYEVRKDFDYKRLPLSAPPSRPASIHAKTIAAGLQAPKVESAALISTSLLAVFLTVYFLPTLKFLGAKGLLLLPGYAKLKKEELLDNRLRDQILQVVKNDPGITMTDLAVRVDAGWGTIVYHLDVLEKNNLVSGLVDGRYHRFFPIGVIDFSARGRVAALKHERAKQLYEIILQEPGQVQEDLARKIGVSPPAAFWHLKRLEDAGMVGRVKTGRKVHYYGNEGRPLAKPVEPENGMEIQ